MIRTPSASPAPSTPVKDNEGNTSPGNLKRLKESESQDWGEDARVLDNTDSDNSDASDNEEEKSKKTTPLSSPITRRLSMRTPSVHIFRVPEINELENANFLNQLAKEIALFPEPPSSAKLVTSSLKSVEMNLSLPPEEPPAEASSPRRKVTDRWAMVAKFARRLTAQDASNGDGALKKGKSRRGSKTMPNVSEDQYV
jgi:hypothetical protein